MKTRRATSLTDYRNQYNETSDTTTRQAVKQQPAQWQAPYTPEMPDLQSTPSATPRHRRGDKYLKAEAQEEAVQPAFSPAVQPAHEGQPQVTPAPRYAADYQDPAAPQPRQNTRYDDQEYDDEDDYEPIRIWPRVLLAVVLIALALCIALYFVPNAGPLQPVKEKITALVNQVTGIAAAPREQPQVLSFQTQSSASNLGSRTLFHITTNQAAQALRLETADGRVLDADIALINGTEETNKIWEANVVFQEAYEGSVYVACQDGESWVLSDKMVSLRVMAPTPQPTMLPTQAPVVTQVPVVTDAPALVAAETQAPAAQAGIIVSTPLPTQAPATEVPVIPTWAPAATAQPTQAPTAEPTQLPTPEPTAEPTQVPTPEPTATPEPVPTATPMPRLTAEGEIGFSLTDTVFIGAKAQDDFQREEGYVAPNPDQYVYVSSSGSSPAAGVLTFRGDNFRRNAAYGTAEIEEETMSVLWKSPVGSLRTEDNGTLWGVGWTGQPAIIKWSVQAREMMNLYEEKKDTKALREVIFGAQDGKIYFLDLLTGEATRDPINVGFPLKGSVSLDTKGRPMLTVGQGISKLASGKTGKIGLHAYSLIDGKAFFLLNGRQSDTQKQYFTNGAFDGTALFLHTNDAIVVAGENGLLYTIDLNSKFTFPDANTPDQEGSLEIDQEITYLRTKASAEKDAQVPVESSVAMYDKYIYMADTYGVLRCVNSDTMETVWAMDNGDNTDAAIALDMDGDTGVSLYTGNTAYSRLSTKKDVSIRRVDALTGEEVWKYDIKCDYNKSQLSGVKASPVIGQHEISDLVIFTVNQVKGGGSQVIALRKADGSVAWTHDMEADSISSPVAVYNAAGEAWVIQADGDGTLYLLDGVTGKVRNTLNLGGEVEASPAVYNDILVIGTCSKDAYMYAIKLQ